MNILEFFIGHFLIKLSNLHHFNFNRFLPNKCMPGYKITVSLSWIIADLNYVDLKCID